MYNENAEVIGVVDTYNTSNILKTIKQKKIIEKRLVDYIHDNLFKNEGISTFSDTYRDNASILAIKNINELMVEYGNINL